MNNTRKIAMFLALFAGLAVCTFGETLYSFTLGFSRGSEQFPDKNYNREQDSIGLLMSVNYYPDNFPLGGFFRASVGGVTSGFEWKDDAMNTLDIYSSTDLRFSLGPSIRLKAGSAVQIPISLGVAFGNYREEDYYSYNNDDDYSSGTSYYEALNLGALADVSLVIVPSRRFIIVNGITATFDFMRWERGFMQMNYRNISSRTFREEKFSSFTFGFYTGIGLRFGGASSGKAKDKNNDRNNDKFNDNVNNNNNENEGYE